MAPTVAEMLAAANAAKAAEGDKKIEGEMKVDEVKPTAESVLEKLTKDQQEAILRKPISECTEGEREVKLLLLDHSFREMKARDRSIDLGSMEDTDKVEMFVPLLPTGDMVDINGHKYYGDYPEMEVRLAREIAYYLSMAYKNERQLGQDMGNLSDSTKLKGEHHIRIRRAQEIQGR